MDMKHIVSSFSPVNLWTKTALWAYCQSSWTGQFSTQRHRCCHRCYVWRLHMLSARSKATNWLMTSKQQCCREVWQEMWNHGCSCGWMTKLRFLNCVSWSWPMTSRLQDGQQTTRWSESMVLGQVGDPMNVSRAGGKDKGEDKGKGKSKDKGKTHWHDKGKGYGNSKGYNQSSDSKGQGWQGQKKDKELWQRHKFCCMSQVSQTRTLRLRSRLLVRQRKSTSGEWEVWWEQRHTHTTQSAQP